MKINGIPIGISPIHIIVIIFFFAIFILSYFGTGDMMYLVWGLPLSLLLLVIPIFSSYNLGTQYIKLLPEYERESNSVRIKNINTQSVGKPVRIEGVVQVVKGKLLCRPSLVIFDGTGSIVAKRSAPLDFPVLVGDNVEVVGMVMKKYTALGDLTVHAIGVKKIENLSPLEDEPVEKIKVKKY